MTGPGIFSYSTTPASNVIANTGINWDEGQTPASVNNSARQNMTDLRNAFNDLIWFRYGKGDLDYSPVYVSATSYKIVGIDVTTKYEVGRRTKATGTGTGTIYGTISAVAFSTDTTVTVKWDSGSLSNETLVVYLSQVPVTGTPIGIGTIRKPMFYAYKTTISTNVTGNGLNPTVTFDTEAYDVGANFAASVFTAPFTGYYKLSARVFVSAMSVAMTNQQIAIVTTAKTFVSAQDVTPAVASGTVSLWIEEVALMTAGDTALVKVQISNGAGNTCSFFGDGTTTYTKFSGELVSV